MSGIQTHLQKENSSARTTLPVRSLGEKGYTAGGKEKRNRVNSIKYSIMKGTGQGEAEGTMRHPEIKKDQ